MIHKSEDNYQFPAFIELSTIDSTNNYALGQLRQTNLTERQAENMHGTAVFAHEQIQGKGQRGKSWVSAPGENLHLSLILNPKPLHLHQQFELTVLTAIVVRQFMEEKAGRPFSIKWPNDIYFQDRKAGGILIENIISGSAWKWAVVGIGLNVNQVEFNPTLPNPVSLKQIAGKDFDCLLLAKELAEAFLIFWDSVFSKSTPSPAARTQQLLHPYNSRLYKRGEKVKLKKGSRIFEATVKEAAENGQLIVETGMEERFDFGQVVWVV